MDYIAVCAASLIVAALTLYSGFGLGTLLLPVFALFFPVQVAVAATAVVHLLNNIYKVYLVGRDADRSVALGFGVPAALAAFAGALLLARLAAAVPVATYYLWGGVRQVTPVKLVVAALLFVFSLFDILPTLRSVSFDRRYIPLGGIVSGFFGGLSGLQGAMRSAFLIKAGLGKEGYIATGALCAVIVDVARLAVYGASTYAGRFASLDGRAARLVVAATLCAFAGSFAAKRLLHKLTLESVHLVVGVMLLLVSVALGAGVI